jgi:glutathione S-transferase
MKLYDDRRAPNSRRVRIFLHEKNVTIPIETVDLGSLQHRTDVFSAINPLRQVPALELDDGSVLTESIAICRYFEVLQPEPALFGEGATGQAFVEMWQRRLELHLLAGVQAVFRHLHPMMKAMEVPQVAEWGEANKSKVMHFLLILERELGDRPFIAGDAFSVADITAMVALDFMKAAKLTPPQGLVRISRWHSNVSSRPSASA